MLLDNGLVELVLQPGLFEWLLQMSWLWQVSSTAQPKRNRQSKVLELCFVNCLPHQMKQQMNFLQKHSKTKKSLSQTAEAPVAVLSCNILEVWYFERCVFLRTFRRKWTWHAHVWQGKPDAIMGSKNGSVWLMHPAELYPFEKNDIKNHGALSY